MGLLRTAIALLAVAVGSHAFIELGDMADIMKDLHHHHDMLRVLVHKHIRPHQYALHRIIPQAPNKTETCNDCHQGGVKYLMEHSMGKLKAMCEMANHKDMCKMKKICGLMAKHPKVLIGMMVEHVRPLSLTTAYCAGKGKCDMPDNMTLAEIEMGAQPHEALLDNFDEVDWHNVLDEAKELEPQAEEEAAVEQESELCEMPKKVCPMCMRHAVGHVMRMAVMKVRKMCTENTHCPVMKKMCPWAKEHKGEAFGMLLAKIEPWKFAFGHCVHGGGKMGVIKAKLWGAFRKAKDQIKEMITV